MGQAMACLLKGYFLRIEIFSTLKFPPHKKIDCDEKLPKLNFVEGKGW